MCWLANKHFGVKAFGSSFSPENYLILVYIISFEKGPHFLGTQFLYQDVQNLKPGF